MSHAHERKEKDCLNCGTIVQGRYCHVCGQENVVPKETFWHMFTHFFYDITHFDSKFFETLKDLLFKPGFLSREYMKGKRVSYLHPVRMYVFTSAIFFLIFFTFFGPKANIMDDPTMPVSKEIRAFYIGELRDKLKKDSNSAFVKERLALALDTSHKVTSREVSEGLRKGFKISFGSTDYTSVKEYDSIQKTLPGSKRDGWFMRRWMRKIIAIDRRFNENPEEAGHQFSENILHKLPYMLFVSLPLFALILRLVYYRRKQFFYADHGVFTIHLYIFSFLLLLVVFMVNKLQDITHVGDLDIIVLLLFGLLLFYLYKAMRNFYGQRRAKTFFKFLIVSLVSFIMMVVLFAIFMFFSAITF